MMRKLLESKYFWICVDIAFIVVAIAVAIFARDLFIAYTAYQGDYIFDGKRILTTNDAYHYATAVKDLLTSHTSDAFFPRASFELPSLLTFALYKSIAQGFGIPFDKFIFSMPTYISSILAIPVYLLAKSIMNRYFALACAILAVLALSYGVRTAGGYFDTDMLILTLPMFGFYFLYKILETQRFAYLVGAVVAFIIALEWHKVSATYLLAAGVGIAIVYVLIKDRKNTQLLGYLGILLLSIAYFNLIAKLIIVAILLHFSIDKPYILGDITKKIKAKLKYHNFIIFGIGIVAFVAANFSLIITRLGLYAINPAAHTSQITLKSTDGSIMELIPFDFIDMLNHTITDWTIFAIGFIGALLLFYRNPKTLILLPMLLLGVLSLEIGMRFAMFSVGVISLGFFYLVFVVVGELGRLIKDKIALKIMQGFVFVALSYFTIAPNYYETRNILLPPVLYSSELDALNAIKEDSKSRQNITISWWDYGFMLPYYTDTRPIIAGSDLDGINHFISSFILSKSQREGYNMAKLALEALDLKEFQDLNNIDRILAKHNENGDIESFMDSLKRTDFKAPKVDNDIYIFLPYSMLAAHTAIDVFSNIKYSTGETRDGLRQTLAQYPSVKKRNKTYVLKQQVKDKNGEVKIEEYHFYADKGIFRNLGENKQIEVQKFHIIERAADNSLKTTTKTYSSDKTKLHMIYSKDLDIFFAIDERTNASLDIQLFLYENYDKSLFTLLHSSPFSKAYKLK